MLKKGKWIRIECDFDGEVFKNGGNWHPDQTLDLTGNTFNEIMKTVKYYNWKKVKGRWVCPQCQKIYFPERNKNEF